MEQDRKARVPKQEKVWDNAIQKMVFSHPLAKIQWDLERVAAGVRTKDPAEDPDGDPIRVRGVDPAIGAKAEDKSLKLSTKTLYCDFC